jgi:hypothetical protein
VSIGEEDSSDQRTDNRMRISLKDYFTMRFGWARGKRKDNAETRMAQRRGRVLTQRAQRKSTEDTEKRTPRAQARVPVPRHISFLLITDY